MANPLGSTPGIIVGVGVGGAAAAALEPAIERPRQDAWKRNAVKELNPATVARLIAEGGIPLDGPAYDAAAAEGFGKDKLDALVYLAQTVPGFAESLALWRRNPREFEGLWHHALTKAGIDQRYLPFLDQLKTDRLSPQVIALAIVRGIIKDPGFLPVGPPAEVGKVKAFPTSAIPALEEAASSGFDRERLFVQTAISGRPMGPEAAASAVFRKIIDKADYQRAIAEGDVRNEWAEAIFEQSRYVLSPADAAGLRLRGWKTKAEADAIGSLHGASPETMEGLFLNRGRPMTPHQMWLAIRRGNATRADFDRAIVQSDIRPEYAKWEWQTRFTYPSLFQLNRLVTDGALTIERGKQILGYQGWEDQDIAAIGEWWASQGGGGGSKWADRAKTRLYTTAHNEYLDHSIDDGKAGELLALVGALPAEIPEVLKLWQAEREINRLELTPAQIVKAHKRGTYTRETALAELGERGLTLEDAETLIADE